MGRTPAALRRAFLLLGGLVAGSGMLLGTVARRRRRLGARPLQADPVPGRVYFLDYVPFLVQPAGTSSLVARSPRSTSDPCGPRLLVGTAPRRVGAVSHPDGSPAVDEASQGDASPSPVRGVTKSLPGRRAAGARCCAASTWRSSRARWWRSSGLRARASRRCSTCSAGWTGRTAARSRSAASALASLAGARARGVPQPHDRLRLPVPPAPARFHGARKRHDARAHRRSEPRASGAAARGGCSPRWAWRSALEHFPNQLSGGEQPARRSLPRPRSRAASPPRRRAHRQSRPGERRAGCLASS